MAGAHGDLGDRVAHLLAVGLHEPAEVVEVDVRESGPGAKSSEVLRHRVGLPRHRPVDVVGEHVGVRHQLCSGKDSALLEEPTDIAPWWRDDLVAFAIGCSFSFEEALLADGIPLKHIERGSNVPMWRTSLPTEAAGPFHGPLVVSMRPLRPADAIRAIQITSRFPSVHGAPVHIGKPELIGIADLAKPDYGDAVPVEADELPVFWACGVTPQSVIAAVCPPFAITHAPGAMLVTDLKNSRLAIL